MHIKHKLLIALAGILLVGVGYAAGFQGLGSSIINQQAEAQTVNSRPVPTLFIHGYGGNAASSNSLIRRIEHDGYGERSLRATVSASGKVTYTGSWHQTWQHPLVQVVFKNNHEGDYHKSAAWIGKIVAHLHARYHIRQFNAVAHSYGNNAIVYYLATHRRHPAAIAKLVDIASCVNTDHEQDKAYAHHQVGGFAVFVKEMKYDQAWYEGKHSPFNGARFSDLNIYGTYQGKPSDGAVSHESAHGLRLDFAGITGTYQEKEFKGRLAQHSALTRSNPQVAQAIASFLKN